MSNYPVYAVSGGSVGAELSASRLERFFTMLRLLFSYSRAVISDQQTELHAFVVVRDQTGTELYREGPYAPSFAISEAQRYAKQIELLGMDKALRSIRHNMHADPPTTAR